MSSRNLVEAILSNPIEADGLLSEQIDVIRRIKLNEVRKRVAAKTDILEYLNIPALAIREDEEYKIGHHPVYGKTLQHKDGRGTVLFKSIDHADPHAAKYKGKIEKTMGGKYIVTAHPDTPINEAATHGNVKSAKEMYDYHNGQAEHHELMAKKFAHSHGLDHAQTQHHLDMAEHHAKMTKEYENGINEEVLLEKIKAVIKMGRVKKIRVRVRNGKVQRNKKFSAVKGYTIRGGKMTRMSAAERRHRKMGARRAKIKRRSKRATIRNKMRRSLRKRKSLGL